MGLPSKLYCFAPRPILLGLATYIGRIAEQCRFAGIGREVFGRGVGLLGAFSSEKGGFRALFVLPFMGKWAHLLHNSEIFFTPCKFLVYGKMNATLHPSSTTFSLKDLVCI